MQIALSILAFLAIVITVILLLPVKVLIKNDEQDNFILRYKWLFKTFGENPDPNDPIVKTLKKAGGVDRFEKASIQKNIHADGLQKTVSDSYTALIGLLKELLFLLKKCTLTRLNITIRCSSEEPDQAAIHYGLYNAATHTFLAVLSSFLRIRKRNCNIDIRCDFNKNDPIFRYEVILAIPFARILAAFWRVVLEEAKRVANKTEDQPK